MASKCLFPCKPNEYCEPEGPSIVQFTCQLCSDICDYAGTRTKCDELCPNYFMPNTSKQIPNTSTSPPNTLPVANHYDSLHCMDHFWYNILWVWAIIATVWALVTTMFLLYYVFCAPGSRSTYMRTDTLIKSPSSKNKHKSNSKVNIKKPGKAQIVRV